MSKTKPNFDDIRRTAHHIGKWLEAMEKGLGYHHKLSGKSKKLLAIATTLDLIGNTPNATINAEALESWRQEIDEARSAIKSLTKKVLTSRFEMGQIQFDDIPW